MSTPATPATAAAKAPPAVPRKIAAPRTLPESQPFWDAADAGRLLLKVCLDCHAPHYYPRDICPHCQSDRTEWRDASGFGTIYSFSTMGKGEAAWTLAYIRLDEGVTMMSNLVDCDPREVEIGQRVRVVFKPSDGGHAVPMFTPA